MENARRALLNKRVEQVLVSLIKRMEMFYRAATPLVVLIIMVAIDQLFITVKRVVEHRCKWPLLQL